LVNHRKLIDAQCLGGKCPLPVTDSAGERMLHLAAAGRFGHVAKSHEWLLTGDELGNR
jgi:hypothetical protein